MCYSVRSDRFIRCFSGLLSSVLESKQSHRCCFANLLPQPLQDGPKIDLLRANTLVSSSNGSDCCRDVFSHTT